MINSVIFYFMTKVVARANWTGIKYQLTGKEYDLSDDDISVLGTLLLSGRYIGLSYRKTHLSSFLVVLGHFFLTGRWVKWSHVWINIDDEITDPYRMRVFEAVSSGTIASPFWKVILCDAVVLLKPKYIFEEDWDRINLAIAAQLGKRYDVFCKHEDPEEVNCCELVVSAIVSVDPTALPGLRCMIGQYGNLTPQMLLECGDFDVCLEIRK